MTCPVIQLALLWIGEINDPTRYIVRLTTAAERNHLTLLLLDRLDLHFGKPHSLAQKGRLDRSGRNGVHANALRGKLKRPAARQMLYSRLARAIERQPGRRLAAVCAGHINDRAFGFLKMWNGGGGEQSSGR
jgi:hypothetical protein